MPTAPVLVVGGSGVVGRFALRWFRERHPDVPVLVGGRNLGAAREAAQLVTLADAVEVDVREPGLGLGRAPVSAVLLLAPDDGLHALRLAQDRGVPYVSISTGLPEVGPELAHVAARPSASAVVLASHWWGGAAVFLALRAAEELDGVTSVRIWAVLDEDDPAGPAALSDMHRLQEAVPATLVFRDGHRTWLPADATRSRVPTIDGRLLDGQAYSPFDVIGVHAATGAREVRFDLAVGLSSSRRRGSGVAAEIVVDVVGTRDGREEQSRSVLEFPHGQASLTGLGAVLTLSSALGLEGSSPAAAGVHLPEQLSDPEWFLGQLQEAGATVRPGRPSPVGGSGGQQVPDSRP